MVLVRELSATEKKKHIQLISQYAKCTYGADAPKVELIEAGQQKGVYKLDIPNRQMIVAVAAARDQNRLLLQDYVVLNELYEHAPAFFPKPYSHSTVCYDQEEKRDLLVMEYIPFPDLIRFKNTGATFGPFNRQLAYRIGRDLGEVTLLTGRFSSEPHDGNILIGVDPEKGMQLKFCDAIQFLKGNLEDATRAVLTYGDHRRECVSFTPNFYKGMKDALMSVRGMAEPEAIKELNFMKKYSGIV